MPASWHPVDARPHKFKHSKRAPFARFPLSEKHPQKSMSSLAVVPVFYQDQDASWQPPCRKVSRIEARRLKNCGAGEFIKHGRAFRLKEPSPPPPIVFLPGPLGVAITITKGEMEANAGLAEDHLVKRAQYKIFSYPYAWDRLSPLPFSTYGPQAQIAGAGL